MKHRRCRWWQHRWRVYRLIKATDDVALWAVECRRCGAKSTKVA